MPIRRYRIDGRSIVGRITVHVFKGQTMVNLIENGILEAYLRRNFSEQSRLHRIKTNQFVRTTTAEKGASKGRFVGRIVWRYTVKQDSNGGNTIRRYSRWRIGTRLNARTGERERITCPATCEFTQSGTIIYPACEISVAEDRKLAKQQRRTMLLAGKIETSKKKPCKGPFRVLFPDIADIETPTRENLESAKERFWLSRFNIHHYGKPILADENGDNVLGGVSLLADSLTIVTDWNGETLPNQVKRPKQTKVSPLGSASMKSENQWLTRNSRQHEKPKEQSLTLLSFRLAVEECAARDATESRLVRELCRTGDLSNSAIESVCGRLQRSKAWVNSRIADYVEVAMVDAELSPLVNHCCRNHD